MSCGVLRFGSRGTDVIGWVGYSAVGYGSQDLFWYVMEWSGFVWLGNAVKVRCCRYGIGAYCLGTAGSLHWCGEVW